MSAPVVQLDAFRAARRRLVDLRAGGVTDAVFGANGALAASFPGYEPRPQQVGLARAIEQAIVTGLSPEGQRDGITAALVGEAPCGTGKSLGYLAPAIVHAVLETEERRRSPDPVRRARTCRVVVVTENNALLEQLVSKDLPTLQRVLAPLLPRGFTFAALMGRGNYACLHKTLHPSEDTEDLDAAEREALGELDRWSLWETETGARGEIDVQERLWAARSVGTEDCLREGCPYATPRTNAPDAPWCHANRAHSDARGADVIVTNYALFLLNLRMRQKTRRNLILPDWDLLILDEAHATPDLAREHLGLSLTPGGVLRPVRWAERQLLPELERRAEAAVEADRVRAREDAGRLSALCERARALVDAMFAEVARFYLDGDGKPLTVDAVRLSRADWWDPQLRTELLGLLAMLETCAELVATAPHDGSKEAKKRAARAKNANRAAETAITAIGQACTLAGAPEILYWCEREASRSRRGRGVPEHRYTLRGADLDIGSVLARELWAAKHAERDPASDQGWRKVPSSRAVIAVSATLTTAGDDPWAFLRRELGFPTDAARVEVPSPFDFDEQALLVLPAGADAAPSPPRSGVPRAQRLAAERAYREAVGRILRTAVEAAGGRTLGLFTSREGLRAAREALVGLPFRILVQEPGTSRQELARLFREDTSSVLLGLQSFGTGFDPAGECCSCVVIDKFTFPPPHPLIDGICAAARAAGRDDFAEERMPRMVLQLRQWVGRGVRTRTDRAAIVLCDPRAVETRYGREAVAALGLANRTGRVTDIESFLGGRA